LKDPENRLSMLRALLEFSGGFGGMPGFSARTPLEKLMAKAEQAVNEALDVPTVEKALADSDWLLRIKTVEHFGNPPAQTSEWERLLPQMEKLAVDGDSAIRNAADDKLHWFPGTEQFLAERLTNETSADVILELLRDRNVGSELNDRFLVLFVPLLSYPDEKVREDALWFVSFNSNRAPMLQFSFGMDVYDRVIASTQAKSAKERAAAASALTDIRQLDADRSREAFLHLANDPDAAVRQQVAWGLAGQFEREDVKRAIAVLLKDKSPGVRFMTILAFGPQKCVPELEALSKGSDPLIADLAAQKLNQLANDKKN
jgi:HEAT repeat protein